MITALSSFFLALFTIFDVARHDFVKKENKVVWLLICLFIGFIGPIIYLTQRKKLLAKFQPAGHRSTDEFERMDLDSRRPEREGRRNNGYAEDELV